MIKERVTSVEHRETMPERPFHVVIVGAACSGKSTLLGTLQDHGYTVHTEPENPVFPLFVENPQKYAFENQLHKTIQLMQLEILDTKAQGLTNPHFRESGVLATEVYNRYLHDKGLLSDDQYGYLHWLHEHHLVTFPLPNLVVYLYAPDTEIRKRMIKRDGLVAMEPSELQPYWDRLLVDMEDRGISVYRINTAEHPVGVTEELIMSQVEKLKEPASGRRKMTPTLRFPSVDSRAVVAAGK